MTKTARVYKIEMLIRNRGHVSFQALLETLEVSPATLKRDLDYLKDQLGAPIVYDRFLNGYKFGGEYRGQKHQLPGLWFSEQELFSLLMAHQLLTELDADGVISRHLQPLLARIHQMLGTSEAETKALLKRVKIIGAAKRPVPSQCFERVGDALLKRRRLHLRYLTRGRGEVSERDVSPQRLVHYRNTWYLDAWCHTREKLLRFALDAVERAEALDGRAKDVPLKQLESEMDGGYGIYAGAVPSWVTLAFSPQAAQWVSREQWHPDQQARWLDDGSFQLAVPYTDPNELAMDILRHADQVSITADTGTVSATVRLRTQQAWELHCADRVER
ncbi:MAG: WYL domain-containing protein [Rubrivivax sp.]|jgi:predicted DNA-binding transcriptional regulator YafY|nr:WYL domain-containing protein [Rubrivivax sp.]